MGDEIKKIKNIATVYEKNIEECKIVLDIIEKNNSSIDKDTILSIFNKNPFIEQNGKLEFSDNVKLELENKNSIDGLDIILSLIAIKNLKSNELYHIISISKNSDIYINFVLLEQMKFNEYFYDRLANLEKQYFELNTILNYLFQGFVYYANSSVKHKYNDFNEYSIMKKIEIIKNIIEITQDNDKFLIIEKFYLFYTSNFKITHNIKKDLDDLDFNIKSILTIDYLLHKVGSNKKFLNTPVKFKTEIYDNPLNLNSLGLSTYQAITVNNIDKNVNSIIGLAGSGKTFLNAKLLKFNLFLDAIYFANRRESLPQLFTSYSYKSVRNFVEIFSQHSSVNLLYLDTSSDLFFKLLEDRLTEINNENLQFSDSDKLKLDEIDVKLMNDNYIDIVENIDKYKKLSDELIKHSTNILPIYVIKAFKKLINNLENEIDKYNFIFEINQFFNSIFNKDELYSYYLNRQLISKLSRYYDFDKKNILDKNQVIELYNDIVEIFNDLYKKHKNSIKYISSLENQIKTVEVILEDIDFDEIEFYIKNYHKLLNREKQDMIKNVISYFLSFKVKNIGDEELLDKLPKNDSIGKYLSYIFPVVAAPVTELNSVYDINFKFYNTFSDEAMLIPSYLTYSIFTRSYNIILSGDINQLNLSYLFNLSDIYDKIKNIYGKEFVKYTIFFNNKLNSKNLFDIIYELNSDVNMLIDNFRSLKDIVYIQVKSNPTYISYMNRFVQKNSKYLNKDMVKLLEYGSSNIDDFLSFINIFNSEKPIYTTLSGKQVDTPLFYQNNGDLLEDRLRKFFQFIDKQGMNNNTILITTLFKQNVLTIKQIIEKLKDEYKITHLDVLSVDKIQSLEYDVLFFESGINGIESESYNYIISNPKLLNVIVSRTRKLFVISCNINFCKNNNSIINDLIINNRFESIE